MQTCQCCNLTILSDQMDQMNVHRRTLHHRTNACLHYGEGVKIVGTAFKCRIVSYRVDSQNHYMDYNTFFNELKQKVLKLLEEVLVIHKIVKVNMEVFGRYNLQTKEYCDVKAFNSSNQVIDQSNDLNVVYNNFADSLTAQAMEFQHRDSGWTIEKILYLEVNVNKFSPLGGSSYIKLPKLIESKKSVVNVVNQDHYCFAWAVTSALYPASARVCELSSYPHFSTVLNVAGMEFPVKLKDIPKFEVMNNCSINVYGLENTFKNGKIEYEVVGPLHYSKSRLNSHVNLLNITDESGNSHYCWIKDLSRLVSSQISTHHHKKYFCDGCLLYFSDERALLRHQLNDCNHISTTTPNTNLRIDKFGECVPENILKFENFEKQLKVPFVVYADFESILKPVHTNEPNPAHSFTNETYFHEPYAFSYILKCSFDDSISKFVLYRGADAAKVFVSNLEADVTNIYHKYLKNVVPMSPLTAEEENDFNIATTCQSKSFACSSPSSELTSSAQSSQPASSGNFFDSIIMSFLRAALMDGTIRTEAQEREIMRRKGLMVGTPLTEAQLDEAMRRRVVVHQDVVIQPPRTQMATMAPTTTTSNVKSLFRDFNPDQEAESMMDLSIEAVPTSQSLEGLLETLNPNLEEPLPDHLDLSDVEDVMLAQLPGVLSQIDSEDEFENPKKRIRANNKVVKSEERSSKKTKPPSAKSKTKPSIRRKGDKLSVFRKRCERNTAIRAWPEATRSSEISKAGPSSLVAPVHQDVHREASPSPLHQDGRSTSPALPEENIPSPTREVAAEVPLSQSTCEDRKVVNSFSYMRSVMDELSKKRQRRGECDSRRRAMSAKIEGIQAQKRELDKQLSRIEADLRKEDQLEGELVAYIEKYEPRVRRWKDMIAGLPMDL
ncbi:uncharacterized protein [Leptinotarsa decemlineata]|uniref:uncharacterized protein n=1 Tax=Leptinotarsa decemlineata TaxID=7539 RepID=UPI003D30CB92